MAEWKRFHSRLLLVFLLSSMPVTLTPITVSAEPYIAVRTGFKCSQCHVNRTGGGKRTAFGLIYGQTSLAMKTVHSSGQPGFVDGRIGDMVSLGGDFRVKNISLIDEKGSDGSRAPSSNQSTITTANLYLDINLIPRTFMLYVDQTVSPTSTNREFFGLLQDENSNIYVKVGRMLLPYGLRIPDDDAFIRNRTRYTYNRHDLGAEIGLEPGPASIIANVTDSQFSMVASAVFRRFRFGGSYGKSTLRSGENTVGGFAGASTGRFTVLGEGDFITDAGVDRFAGLLELNFLATRGLNFKGTYEFFDRNTDVPNDNDGQERITIGIEAFPIQFLQFGVYYRINNFIPQNAAENQNRITILFHAFL